MINQIDDEQDETEQQDPAEAFGEQLAELLVASEFVRRVSTFAEAGVLTRDTGVVVRLVDGSRVFLTIQHRED